MNEIIKKEDLELLDNLVRTNAQNFQKMLHKPPKKEELQTNPHANNSKYLPISFLEMTLDEMFFGLWQTENFRTKVVANEIVGEIEVKYYHPTHKVWITRTGAGAVQIQMISEKKGGTGDITDIGQKIKNTLTKDYPHLKAECFRNACLSIGKAFGRDLNRNFEDQYQPIIKPLDSLDDKLRDELSTYKNPNELESKKIEIRDKYIKLGMNKKEATDIIFEVLNAF